MNLLTTPTHPPPQWGPFIQSYFRNTSKDLQAAAITQNRAQLEARTRLVKATVLGDSWVTTPPLSRSKTDYRSQLKPRGTGILTNADLVCSAFGIIDQVPHFCVTNNQRAKLPHRLCCIHNTRWRHMGGKIPKSDRTEERV